MARLTHGLNVFCDVPDIALGDFVVGTPSVSVIISDREVVVIRTANNIFIEVPPGSRAVIIEEPAMASGVQKLSMTMHGGKGSQVTYAVISFIGGERTSVAERAITLDAQAELTWWNASWGGSFVMDELRCDLKGEGSALRHRSIFFGDGNEQVNFYVGVRHCASVTTSDIRGRGVLAGSAKAIFRGMIRVEAGIRAARGYQKEDTLLLGDKAEIDALPHLEILSDDVVCGHSASHSELNREHLFYLQSRGLSDEAAREALIAGFFVPLVQDIDNAEVRRKIEAAFKARLFTWKTQQI